MRKMKFLRLCASLLLVSAGAHIALGETHEVGEVDKPQQTSGTHVHILTLTGVIGPTSSDYITRGFAKAQTQNAAAIVIRMDTPGGLDTAMRDIIKAILASPVPVIVYVSPSGARAASAGTYILYAAHIAAMTPGTNLGAATPVMLSTASDEEKDTKKKKAADDKSTDDKSDDETKDAGADDEDEGEKLPDDAMGKKMVNDAAAYIRSLAELRGRNKEWAEAAVRGAESLSAEEAFEKNVIDIIADNLPELLAEADGRIVELNGEGVELHLAGLPQIETEPDWRTQILSVITHPALAHILLSIGVTALVLEFYTGAILPGVFGAIALLVGLYGIQVFPVSFAGIALVIVGIIFVALEFTLPSFGALGIGGIIAFLIGSLILFDPGETGGLDVSYAFLAAFAGPMLLSILLAVFYFGTSARKRVVAGAEGMVGATGEVLDDAERGKTRLRIAGEVWSAESQDPLRRGDRARVARVDNLLLHVLAFKEEDKT